MTGNQRGWWRRIKADAKNVSPWPEEFLDACKTEAKAWRKRARHQRRDARKMLRKAAQP